MIIIYVCIFKVKIKFVQRLFYISIFCNYSGLFTLFLLFM